MVRHSSWRNRPLNGFVQTYAFAAAAADLTTASATTGTRRCGSAPARARAAGPADLPCSQLVTEAFVLEPSQEATFSAGKAQSLHTNMDVLANQGWNGHVTVKAAGALPATVTPPRSTFAAARSSCPGRERPRRNEGGPLTR